MARRRSTKAEQAELSEALRAQGWTWAEIAGEFQRRYAINARVAFRVIRGWSQGDVAREWTRRWPKPPNTAQNISRWERWPVGGHEPALTTLGRLAEIYECDLAHLVADLYRHQHRDSATHSPAAVPVASRLRAPIPAERESDHLSREAELLDPLDLAGMATASDIGSGMIDVVHESADRLCRAYAAQDAIELRDRSRTRLAWINKLLSKRVSLGEHTELLVAAGWMAALLGCVHYDLGEREQAEAARQAAARFADSAGHGELAGWAHEMAAWFALTEGRWEDLIAAAQAGQQVAGASNAGVQLVLQEAKGHARLRDTRAAREALDRGAVLLDRLPNPNHAEHHFVFDRTKWSFYAATIYAGVGDTDAAEEHARVVLAQHLRPDGTSNAPMRIADTRIDLATVYAHRGDLDAAVSEGLLAFSYGRKSLPSLLRRSRDLDQLLASRYPNDPRATEFSERLHDARSDLRTAGSSASSHPNDAAPSAPD
jgi:tetratricopeptide (TPR) repeat protein